MEPTGPTRDCIVIKDENESPKLVLSESKEDAGVDGTNDKEEEETTDNSDKKTTTDISVTKTTTDTSTGKFCCLTILCMTIEGYIIFTYNTFCYKYSLLHTNHTSAPSICDIIVIYILFTGSLTARLPILPVPALPEQLYYSR